MALLRSETIGSLMTALAKAQGEFPPIKKDSKNYYGGKYAQLDAIVDAVRPALSKNGIAFYHICESDLERRTASVTTYLQLGEEWIADFAEASAVSYAWDKDARERLERFDTQTMSIVWTYFRRTTLQAITGVAAEEDTDSQELVGNNPSIPKKTTPAQALATAPKQQPATQPQQTQQSPPPKQEDRGIFRLMPDGVLTCFIKGITTKETKEKKPYLVVTVNGYLKAAKDEQGGNVNHGFCYDTGLFDALKLGVTKECQLKLDLSGKFVKITEVFYVDGQEFVEGKPVVLPTDDEPVPEP